MTAPLPTRQTLARYGLSAEEWLALAGDACRICERPWSDKVKPVTDHQHVRGWKTLSPEERRKYVRGVVCRGDNHFVLGVHLTAAKAEKVGQYLREYDARRQEMG